MKRSVVNHSEGTASGTSSELLRQAKADDQDAWMRLVDLYSRRMYRWCRRAGLQPADAANVVQDALQAGARPLIDFRRERPGDTFRGWLRRITDNKIRDHYRRTGRRVDVAAGGELADQLLAEQEDPLAISWDTTRSHAPHTGADSIAAAIEQVKSQVTPRDWRFFWRIAVDGQTAADVAREYGMNAGAVRLVKMRVLKRLRQCMADQNAERP